MIYIQTKFKILNPNGSLFIAVKQRAEEIRRTVDILMFCIRRKVNETDVAYFLIINYRA